MKTEADIIAEVLNGNQRAYAELVRLHQEPVRRYCAGIFGAGANADDAAQEVFIKAYRGLKNFQAKSAFGTWLYRIAVNHCRDLLRKKMRRKEDSLDQIREAQGDAFTKGMTAASGREASAAREIAEKVLASVSQQARTVLILREIEELSYEEIMKVLGCSMDAVKSRLKRARQEVLQKNRHLFQEARV